MLQDAQQRLPSGGFTSWNSNEQVNQQVKDMKDQTAYLAAYRSVLKQALQQVHTLKGQVSDDTAAKTFGEMSMQTNGSEFTSEGGDLKQSTQSKIVKEDSCGHHRSTSPESSLGDSSGFREHIIDESTNHQQQHEQRQYTEAVVADAAEKLGRLKALVIARNRRLGELRMRLQQSNALLQRRESKLEEKLREESSLKMEKEDLLKKTEELRADARRSGEELRAARVGVKSREKENLALRRELDSARREAESLRRWGAESEDRARFYQERMAQERERSARAHHECLGLRRALDQMRQDAERFRRNETAYNANRADSSTRGPRSVDLGSQNAQRGPRQWGHGPGTLPKGSPRFPGCQHLSPIQEDGEEGRQQQQIPVTDRTSEHNALLTVVDVKDSQLQVSDESVDQSEPDSSRQETSAYPYLVVASRRNVARNLSEEFDADRSEKDSAPKEVSLSSKTERVEQPVSHMFLAPPSPTPSNLSAPSDVTSATYHSSDVTSSDVGSLKGSKPRDSSRKRKSKSSKHLRYCGHKIDVTDFTMERFREILWSSCDAEHSADQFLEFLASHAQRLQADERWRDRHTLGSAQDWLSLRGCY